MKENIAFEDIRNAVIQKMIAELKNEGNIYDKKFPGYAIFKRCVFLFIIVKLMVFRFKIPSSKSRNQPCGFIYDHGNLEYTKFFRDILEFDFKYTYFHVPFIGYVFYLIATHYNKKTYLFQQIKFILRQIIGVIRISLTERYNYPLKYYERLLDFYLQCFNHLTLFNVYPPSFVFTVDDFVPSRIGLCYVANFMKVPIIYGQIDMYNFSVPPTKVDIALVNSKEAIEYFNDGLTIVHQKEKIDYKINIRKIPSNPKIIGLVPNNFYVKEKLISAIALIIQKHPNSTLYIKYHPNTKTKDKPLFSSNKIVEAKEETLESYSNKCDYIIASNTTAQMKVLLKGCPVIHISGIDRNKFDLNGYVKKKVIFGCKIEELKAIDIESVNEFYSNPCWKVNITKMYQNNSNKSIVSREYLKKYIKQMNVLWY
ncbi:hypothetical protein SAMN06295989_10721 [Methanohalophilus euhalobius]|uniref:Capsule polysaccharide biosynthesis protein n=2 Tax=Methanohalophilus TaxID=2175 RepID=A0A285G0L1_9EURY|nr:MAG: hypothetical protein A8273_1100 [Methanohalophilus sp. 2-GBenrich]SNY17120.1 hypothetical protein SAMN06295989_10721 [Methanohalophilus euhalobius]